MDSRTLVSLSEGRVSWRGTNKQGKTVARYRVDNCLLTIGEKCDFLVKIDQDKRVILLELKGSDHAKALGQLIATIKTLGPKLKHYQIDARTVLTRSPNPRIIATKEKELRKLLKEQGGNYRYSSLQLEEDI